MTISIVIFKHFAAMSFTMAPAVIDQLFADDLFVGSNDRRLVLWMLGLGRVSFALFCYGTTCKASASQKPRWKRMPYGMGLLLHDCTLVD
jgi:hypothetical protein